MAMEARDKEPLWLVIEWPPGRGQADQVHPHRSRRMSKKQIAPFSRSAGAPSGLRRPQGRAGSITSRAALSGWHHHVSVVLYVACSSSLNVCGISTVERPDRSRRNASRPEPIRRFVHHDTSSDRGLSRSVAPALSDLPSTSRRCTPTRSNCRTSGCASCACGMINIRAVVLVRGVRAPHIQEAD